MSVKYADAPVVADKAIDDLSRQLSSTREAWSDAVNAWLDGPDYVDTVRLKAERLEWDCKTLELTIGEARAQGLRGLAIQSRLLMRLLHGNTPANDDRVLTLIESMTFRLEELAGKEVGK